MIFCFRRPQYFTSHTGFSLSPVTRNRLSNRNVSLGCLWFRWFQYGDRITIIIIIIMVVIIVDIIIIIVWLGPAKAAILAT